MRTLTLALTAAACLALTLPAMAGDGCGCGGDPGCSAGARCGQCGCHAPCKKVCRVVCEMKKVEITCWEVKCEDFCAPLPRLCGRGCGGDPGCGDCGAEPSCGNCDSCKAGCGEKCIQPPKCGKVRSKKTLVKKTVAKEVPVYKCVVEYVCCDCSGCGVGTEAPKEALPPVAPPPKGTQARATVEPSPPIPDAPLPLPRFDIRS